MPTKRCKPNGKMHANAKAQRSDEKFARFPKRPIPETMQLLLMIIVAFEPKKMPKRRLDVVELNCGKAAITTETMRLGMNAIGIDRDSACAQAGVLLQDMQEMKGLKKTFKTIWALRSTGILWVAPTCSSFVFLSQAVAGRNIVNEYMGNMNMAFVRKANHFQILFSAMVVLAWLRGAMICVEQPTSSVLQCLEPVPTLIRQGILQNNALTTDLGAFGADTKKAIKVLCNDAKGAWKLKRRSHKSGMQAITSLVKVKTKGKTRVVIGLSFY